MRHWFDGFAMLHRFGIADGEVSYANRFLQTKAYRAAEEKGEIVYSEFATDPCRSLFARVFSMFSPKLSDNANVNLVKLGERYISMTETPIPVEFDGDTLETVGVAYEPPGMLTTAHPHLDRATGGCSTTPRSWGRGTATASSTSLPTARQPRVIGELPVKEPAYMHSFGLTERWLVLAEFPLVVNPISIPLSGRPYIENYRWKPELGTRFTLIDRDTGEATGPFETDPFFCFHHVNAYEENGAVVVDACTYENAQIVEDLYLDRLRDGKPADRADMRRFRIDLGSRKVTQRAARRGPRAAADQLRPQQRASLPLRLGDRREVGMARPDRQGRHRGARAPSTGARTAAAPVSQCSWRRRTQPTRTPASCSRSSSTPARAARSCSSSTRRT